MKIGRLLRYAKAHVFVTGRCASACMLTCVGGVYRSAPSGRLGIQCGRTAASPEPGRIGDVDTRASPGARLLLDDAEAQVAGHLAERGKEVERRYGVPESEYARRTETVLTRCGEPAQRRSTFIHGYRTALLAPH